MNIREKNLIKILSLKYLENDNITFIDSKDIKPGPFRDRYNEAYHALGAKGMAPEMSLKGYLFENTKFVLELDDRLTYNRYRLKTLRSDIYDSFPGINVERHRIYCNKFENECLKAGSAKGIWTNPESEAVFGKSEQPGDFGLNGSSGWKRMAMENFLKDLYARYKKLRLLRISVWDEILINKQLVKLVDLLSNPDKKTVEHILNHIERRVINLFSD